MSLFFKFETLTLLDSAKWAVERGIKDLKVLNLDPAEEGAGVLKVVLWT